MTLIDLDEKTIEAADLMTLTITVLIQIILKKAKFHDGCKIYRCLKKLFQPTVETQVMPLTWEPYTLTYKDFANITEFLDYIKLLEKQIDVTKITITEDKRTLLCLTMALWNIAHLRLLVQIWRVNSEMMAKKAQ